MPTNAHSSCSGGQSNRHAEGFLAGIMTDHKMLLCACAASLGLTVVASVAFRRYRGSRGASTWETRRTVKLLHELLVRDLDAASCSELQRLFESLNVDSLISDDTLILLERVVSRVQEHEAAGATKSLVKTQQRQRSLMTELLVRASSRPDVSSRVLALTLRSCLQSAQFDRCLAAFYALNQRTNLSESELTALLDACVYLGKMSKLPSIFRQEGVTPGLLARRRRKHLKSPLTPDWLTLAPYFTQETPVNLLKSRVLRATVLHAQVRRSSDSNNSWETSSVAFSAVLARRQIRKRLDLHQMGALLVLNHPILSPQVHATAGLLPTGNQLSLRGIGLVKRDDDTVAAEITQTIELTRHETGQQQQQQQRRNEPTDPMCGEWRGITTFDINGRGTVVYDLHLEISL